MAAAQALSPERWERAEHLGGGGVPGPHARTSGGSLPGALCPCRCLASALLSGIFFTHWLSIIASRPLALWGLRSEADFEIPPLQFPRSSKLLGLPASVFSSVKWDEDTSSQGSFEDSGSRET